MLYFLQSEPDLEPRFPFPLVIGRELDEVFKDAERVDGYEDEAAEQVEEQ